MKRAAFFISPREIIKTVIHKKVITVETEITEKISIQNIPKSSNSTFFSFLKKHSVIIELAINVLLLIGSIIAMLLTE